MKMVNKNLVDILKVKTFMKEVEVIGRYYYEGRKKKQQNIKEKNKEGPRKHNLN